MRAGAIRSRRAPRRGADRLLGHVAPLLLIAALCIVVGAVRQHLHEGDREDRAPRRQRFRKSGVARRFVQRLGLGLTVARRQVHPPVAASGDGVLQLDQQRGGIAAAAVGPVGPDPLELGSLRVESRKRAAGDGHAVHLADQKTTVGRRELHGRDRLQPGHDGRRRALVALRVLDGQLIQQGLGPGIVRRHRDKAELLGMRGSTG